MTGGLAHVDDPHRLRESRHDTSRGEAVDDDDVCTGEEFVTADGEQAVVTGTAADEGDPTGAAGAVTAEVEATVAQREVDAVPHCCRQQGVAAGVHGHRDAAVGSRDVGASGDARGRGARVGGVDAPHPQCVGIAADRRVDVGVTRGRVGKPGVVEIGGPRVVALQPGDPVGVLLDEVMHLFADPGRDEPHDRTFVQEGPEAATRDRPAAEDGDESAGQVEDDRQGGLQISHASSPSGCVGASAAVGNVAPTMPAATVRPSWASMRRKDPPRREVE